MIYRTDSKSKSLTKQENSMAKGTNKNECNYLI